MKDDTVVVEEKHDNYNKHKVDNDDDDYALCASSWLPHYIKVPGTRPEQ